MSTVTRTWKNNKYDIRTGRTAAGSSTTAAGTSVDTTNFDNKLSSADNTVQKALETLDDAAGGMTWSLVTGTSNTSEDLIGYLMNGTAGACTVSLNPTPVDGEQAAFLDAYKMATTNTLTIGRGGKTIDGDAEDFVLDVDGVGMMLVFNAADDDWKIAFAVVRDGSVVYMDKDIYDPQDIGGDAFDRANHTGSQADSTIVDPSVTTLAITTGQTSIAASASARRFYGDLGSGTALEFTAITGLTNGGELIETRWITSGAGITFTWPGTPLTSGTAPAAAGEHTVLLGLTNAGTLTVDYLPERS